MTDEFVASPCVNICVLGLDKICAGCYRNLEEITAWSDATKDQRLAIVEAARKRQELDVNGKA